MEGTIGEIRWFAGNFQPKNWAYCQGQLIPIRSNTALFSILGATYGGDGQTTFGLPNFKGSVAVGAGSKGPGLSSYDIGDIGGAAGVAIDITTLPGHLHGVSVTPGTPTATIALNGVSGSTATSDPTGALLQGDPAMNTFAAGTSTTVPMAPAAVNLTNIAGPTGLPTVTIQPAGGTPAPHNNVQPYLGMNFIVCMYGNFPARN